MRTGLAARFGLSICSMRTSPAATMLSMPRGSLTRIVTSLSVLMSGTAPEKTTSPVISSASADRAMGVKLS